jgi:hypothetical protein
MIRLAPGADANGFAVMLADLLRQNLSDKPHKRASFDALSGVAAIVAEDADVAITLRFSSGEVEVFDGIVGVPDMAIRGGTDEIFGLSNLPISTPFALPIAARDDTQGQEASRAFVKAIREKRLHLHGAMLHPLFALRLTRVMSING